MSQERTLEVIKSIQHDFHVQSRSQTDRFIIFSIYQFILSSKNIIDTIVNEKYGSDFIYAFIQSMDGEKDPRNLILCFECICLICQHFNLGPFVEETFEVFACYFPIDFTPPKNDKFVITQQMLINSLRKCFASTKQFAKFSIPLFMEKLNSSVTNSQLDAMLTYAECARTTYDPNDYKAYIIDGLWSSFQQIAMHTTTGELEAAALEAIEATAVSITRCLQHKASDDSQSLSIDWFINKAMQSCVAYLSEPDLKLVWPNVKCLHAIAASSSTANILVINRIIPLLIEHYNSTSIVSFFVV
jgi:DNA repair/transcription protein MET18/MMS19